MFPRPKQVIRGVARIGVGLFLLTTGAEAQLDHERILWSFWVGGGNLTAAPALAGDGTLYTPGSSSLYAVAPDGTEKWRLGIRPADWISPAVGMDGTVYAVGGRQTDSLFAIDPQGMRKWSVSLISKATLSVLQSAPAIGGDGTIFIGSQDGRLYAIAPEGQIKWSLSTGDRIDSSPAVGEDGTVYVGSEDGSLYAIHPGGYIKWLFDAGGPLWSSPALDPEGTVYIAGSEGLYAVDPGGALVWRFPLKRESRSSPIVDREGHILVLEPGETAQTVQGGTVYSIGPDGRERWQRPLGGVGWRGTTSLLLGADDTLYLIGEDDNFWTLFALNAADGQERWHMHLDAVSSYAVPLLAMSPEGVLYLGSRDYLYAVRAESPGLGNSVWPRFHRDAQNTGRVPAAVGREEEPASTRYRVSGRIVLPDGAPVAGALIGPWGPGPLVYSGIQGEYEMELEPGEYTFRIKLPGIGPPVQELAVAVSGDTRVDVVLEAELPASDYFVEVTATHLPVADLMGPSMDARPGDLDGDGDLDLVVASEYLPNILLLNDGGGHFANGSQGRLPQPSHDSEEVGIADLNGDGNLDIVIITEDDRVNELYLNDGRGFFADAGERFPVAGRSNAVLVEDIDGDGDTDILIGNKGQNALLLNDGQGFFADATETRLPLRRDITQDLGLGDVDGDGDLDLLVGNEDDNRLLFNDGQGFFADAPEGYLPLRLEVEETRQVDFGDVDGDGDLDIFFANVELFRTGAVPQNRLLRNDGQGFFVDETEARLPPDQDNSFDGGFVDLDRDGVLDLVTANAFGTNGYRAYFNDGHGIFTDHTAEVFPPGSTGNGFDVEAADYNGDGVLDLYLCSRGGSDRLLLGRALATAVSGDRERPWNYALEQNYPNPFNGQTFIAYHIARTTSVELTIYNLVGQRVRRLVHTVQEPGDYKVRWDGTAEGGRKTGSGIYLYRLTTGEYAQTRRLILVR